MKKIIYYASHSTVVATAGVCLLVILIAYSIRVNLNLEYYTMENEMYFPFYLGTQPYLYKLFYYPITDVYYRAREFSNVLSVIDAHLVLWSAKFGFPHFLSYIYYIFIILIVSTVIIVIRKYFKSVSPWIAFLLAATYITSPAIFLTGMFFRPSKIAVSLTITYCFLISFISSRSKNSKLTGILVFACLAFICTVLSGVSDELGMGFTLLFGTVHLVYGAMAKNGRSIIMSIAYLLGLVFLALYRTILGPILVERITGLTPTIWGVSGIPLPNFESMMNAIGYYTTYVRYYFGNIPTSLLFLPVIIIWTYLAISMEKSRKISIVTILKSFFVIFAVGTTFSLFLHIMSQKHPVITWPEYLLIYYPIPFTTFLFISITIVFHTALKKYPKARYPVFIILLFWLYANITAIPTHEIFLTKLTTSKVYYHTFGPQIIDAIRRQDIPITSFPYEHLETAKIFRELIQKL